MKIDYNRMTDDQLVALHRVAKTKGKAFFTDVKEMIGLRTAMKERKLGIFSYKKN
jgi:hypothetical protein